MTQSYRPPPPRSPSVRPRPSLVPEAGTQPTAPQARVLVVDDEPNVRRSLARVLMTCGFDVLTAEDGPAALSLLESGMVDVMLVDMLMPRMGGIDLLERVKAQHPEVE